MRIIQVQTIPKYVTSSKPESFLKHFMKDELPLGALPMYDTGSLFSVVFDPYADNKVRVLQATSGRLMVPLHEFSERELEYYAWQVLLKAAQVNPIHPNEVETFFASRDLPFKCTLTHDGRTIAITEPEFLGIWVYTGSYSGLAVLNESSVAYVMNNE